MTKTGSYDFTTHNITPETELHRLLTQVEMIWEKEKRTLSWFGLADGMSVVELGSGPGFVTEKISALLPNSLLTAVELDPLMVKYSQQYLPEKTKDKVTFVNASVTDTGLPDNTFDFAIARLIFQHLPDPATAANEIFRILKPGGKLVITDTDADIYGIMDPPTPAFKLALEKFGQGAAALGGNFRVGRHLWTILQKAGFGNLDLEAVIAHSNKLGIEPFMSHPLQVDILLRLVKLGLLTEEELDAFRASRDEFLASPNPLVMLVWLMVCGEKPSVESHNRG